MCGLMFSNICCHKPWYLGHDIVFWGSLVLLVGTEQLTEYVYAHGLLKIPITFTSNPSIHRVVMWCAQWHTYTTAPIFFHMIINTEDYLKISDKSFNLMDGWMAGSWHLVIFRKVGQHVIFNWALEEINIFFWDKLISKELGLPWSIVLTLLSILIWDLLKGRVLKSKPWTIGLLNRNIINKTTAIPLAIVTATFTDMQHCQPLSPGTGKPITCNPFTCKVWTDNFFFISKLLLFL